MLVTTLNSVKMSVSLQFFVLSGMVAMVTCAVFLRLSCLLKLAVLMLVIAVYTYLIEVAFHVLFIRQHQNSQIQRYSILTVLSKRSYHAVFLNVVQCSTFRHQQSSDLRTSLFFSFEVYSTRNYTF